MASLPIMRMTWRLRRANSRRSMDVSAGFAGRRIGLLTERQQLLEHHLRRDPDEFHELCIGLLVGFVLVRVVSGGAGDLREVPYDFAYIARERFEVRDLPGTEAIQKPGAP